MTPDSTDKKRSNADAAGPLRAPGLIVFGLAFVAIAGVIVAGLWLRHDNVSTDGRRYAENLAAVLSADLEMRIEGIEEALRELAAFSRFIGGPDAAGHEWMTLLRTAAAGRQGFEALMVTDSAGRITFSSLPILMGESRAGGDAFDELSQNPRKDTLVADAPERSTNDSKLVVPLARVIRTPNAEFEGMAVANFAPEQLREFYRELDVGETGIVWLLGPSGTVLLREPPSNTPNDEPWPSALTTDVRAGHAGVTNGPVESGGAQYVTAYRSLPDTNLTAAVSLATGDIFTFWWNEVYAAAALTLLVGAFLLIAAIHFVRRARPFDVTPDSDSTPAR